MWPHLQIVIQAQLGKLILQVNPEVHVLHRVDHNVDELHAGHLQGQMRDSEDRAPWVTLGVMDYCSIGRFIFTPSP